MEQIQVLEGLRGLGDDNGGCPCRQRSAAAALYGLGEDASGVAPTVIAPVATGLAIGVGVVVLAVLLSSRRAKRRA